MCGNWLTRIVRRLGFGERLPHKDMYHTSQKRKKRALVVVDVQNDFISGSLSLSNCPSGHNGSEVVKPINKLVTSPFWDMVAYSKDWHPENHVSFVTNVGKYEPHCDNKTNLENAQVFDFCVFNVGGEKIEQTLWPAHCVQQSEGAEFHKDLNVIGDGIIIYKGMDPSIDSYSAFYDNKKRSETILRQVLQDNGIEQVYICGIATDVCVKYTVFNSHELGFETILIEDCCRGVDQSDCDETIRQVKESGMEVLSHEQVLERAEKALKEEAKN